MPPTMFKLVRATILLVSDTISSLFFSRMAFVGFMRLWLAQSTLWPLPFPKRCPLEALPAPGERNLIVELASTTASIEGQAVSDKVPTRSFGLDSILRCLNDFSRCA
jgi:hypothetical protein